MERDQYLIQRLTSAKKYPPFDPDCGGGNGEGPVFNPETDQCEETLSSDPDCGEG